MINETGVYFFPGGGHNHDGESASLIDTNFYSIFDFPWTTEIGGPDRKRRLENNYNSFKNFIITTVNDSIIRPAGIFFQPGSINASSDIITNSITTNLIQAGAITADLIAANTITANNIQAGAITGNLLNANVVLVNQAIFSNNYVPGVSGWIIDGDGTAEFGDASIRGTIDIGGNDATSFHVNSSGDMFVGATTFNAAPFKVSSVGSITAVSGNIAGFEFVAGTNLLHTGGSFLGTLDLGLISGNGVSANSRVGLEVIGPQPPGKRLEALYDYLYIYREDTGSGVLLTPEGDITASGEIICTDLAVVNTIDGDINGNASTASLATTALNADRLDNFLASASDVAGTVAVRGGDASVMAGYLIMTGGETIGASTGSAVRKRSDGYLLTVSSRREIKNSIEDISSDFAYSIINALQPVSFRFNEQQYIGDLFSEREAEYREYGFIAQDVGEVNSNLVSYSVNAEGDGIQPSMWSDFALISLSVSAIKGLIFEISELKSKLSELESYLFNGPNNEV